MYIKEELFQTLCPGLANNPSDALDRVSQEVTDNLGNTTRLTIHAYFTNNFTALQYMIGLLIKDSCIYGVDNMCQDIKDHLELSYTAPQTQRPRDKYSQMIALRDLQKSVNNLTTSALLVNNMNCVSVVPGLSPSDAVDAAAVALHLYLQRFDIPPRFLSGRENH